MAFATPCAGYRMCVHDRLKVESRIGNMPVTLNVGYAIVEDNSEIQCERVHGGTTVLASSLKSIADARQSCVAYLNLCQTCEMWSQKLVILVCPTSTCERPFGVSRRLLNFSRWWYNLFCC